MGIEIEFNPDLALRKHKTPGKLENECLPEKLEAGKTYHFLKKSQRNYWLRGEIPLCETDGNGKLSKPIASIRILKATHLIMLNEIYTKGSYKVHEVYDVNNPTIHFEDMNKVKR